MSSNSKQAAVTKYSTKTQKCATRNTMKASTNCLLEKKVFTCVVAATFAMFLLHIIEA